ncbi:DUF397 domain-containing protein [Actinopolyspora sp. H202]|uniref:DUF397 domain-containing protein n=1 Tax=Actinopolyspora sp. H202 TaxID=1500456 RepID=UPI003EE6EC12
MTSPAGPTRWRKPTRSQNTSTCVEVGWLDNVAAVRDSKNHAVGYVTAERQQWQTFIAAIKANRFS